jgi:hypothetical protein
MCVCTVVFVKIRFVNIELEMKKKLTKFVFFLQQTPKRKFLLTMQKKSFIIKIKWLENLHTIFFFALFSFLIEKTEKKSLFFVR